MQEFYVYHVVTEQPMELGQIIIFDKNNSSGVKKRVKDREKIVDSIYKNPSIYKDKELDHHTKVALRELALEKVRLTHFKECPSRLNCLYTTKTLEEANYWGDYFIKLGRAVYQIVKLKVVGRSFTANACNCFEGTINKDKNIELSFAYWTNQHNNNQLSETLVDGTIEVVEITKEFNSYIHKKKSF